MRVAVSVRLVFGIAAAAVLAVGVYLLVQVHASPASPSPSPSSAPEASEAAREPAPARSTPMMPAAPTWRPQLADDTPAAGSAQPGAAGNRFVTPATRAALHSLQHVNLRMDSLMDQASKAYEGQDYKRATLIAGKILSLEPNNLRMLRIMVSSACATDDAATAQKYYTSLPPHDRQQMTARCEKAGITFTDPS